MTTNTLWMVVGRVFTAATHLQLAQRDRKLVVQQPGYRRGEKMVLAQTPDNGVRLYVAVAAKWMDGSLRSIV